jgi:hypothetical protein
MASKVLNEISKDDAERVAYIEHLIWTTDQESKLFYAEKKGKISTAKNMLLKWKYSINEISDCTGLSTKVIERLQDEFN